MPGERILIVEDEPAVTRGLQYGLERDNKSTATPDSAL